MASPSRHHPAAAGRRFLPFVCAALATAAIATAIGAEEKGVAAMTASELEKRLAEKAAAYRPPPEALRVLPFDPAGWKTNDAYEPLGDPRAKKGGSLTSVWPAFPPNLRTDGPESNIENTRALHSLAFEMLVDLHPTTLEFTPWLATHWSISDDRRTFRFRLNPKARFSDGSEVTSDDVYWTFWHMTREDRQDPYNMILYGDNYEMPTIVDKYTIEVKTKKLDWRLFHYVGAAMPIFPAEYIAIAGDEYLAAYQWRFMPGSGPYELRPDDVKKGTSLTLRRRPDWWAKDERWAQGLYNFDALSFVVVTSMDLEFQKFKSGEIDYYVIRKAQRWVEETDFDKIQNGWILKRRIKTQAPQGFSGFCLNMRKPPFDDRRVRQAWAYLFNREKLMEKLFYKEYDFIDSYYPGQIWANPANRKIRFDPRRAAALLAEAGYATRDARGILLGPDGKPLEVTFEYGRQEYERLFTVIKEDYEKAGIRINLKLMDATALYQKVSQREFTLHYVSWSAVLFPNPEGSWLTELADKPSTNNYPGFKNPRVDALCEEYSACFDQKEREEIIRKIDKLIFDEHPYALGWFTDRVRLLFWNKFGHPERYFTRTGDERDILKAWWYDGEMDRRLGEAMRAGAKLERGEVEVAPWDFLGPRGLPVAGAAAPPPAPWAAAARIGLDLVLLVASIRMAHRCRRG